MNRKLIFIFSILYLLNFISFVNSSLIFERNSQITLNVPCIYNGTFCETGTSCNISILYPNGSLMVENDNTIYNGNGIITYDVPDSSLNGDYKTIITCWFPDGNSDSGNADFTITPNGENPNLAKTLIYLGLILILMIIFVLSIYGIIKIDSLGWRIGLMAFSYILLNGFLLMSWKLAEVFLTSIPFIETVFRILYIISNVGYFPVFIALVFYMLIKLSEEKSLQTLISRGYDENTARRITYRKKK